MIWIRILLFLALVIIEKSIGNEVPGHVKYLLKYGYLEVPEEGNPPYSFSAESIESALKTAQKFFGIQVTGKLDNQTEKILSSHWCGMPDVGTKANPYSLARKWNKRNLTYGFVNYSPQLRPDEITIIIELALDKWSRASGLRFTPNNVQYADIRIGFFKGEHGDGFPFNRERELAHAFYPGPDFGGDVHFNDYVPWVAEKKEADYEHHLLFPIALHQIGHALGLKHSSDPESVMNPISEPGTELAYDDIQGIQKLYYGS